MKKVIYIPIESRVRELDAKSLLASTALRFGWDVIIGREDVLNEHIVNLPRGIYIAKNVNKDKVSLIESIRKTGHAIAMCDEEAGLAQNDQDTFLRQRFDTRNLEHLDVVFLWSDEQKRVFDVIFTDYDVLTKSLGTPRLDLMTKHHNALVDEGADYYRTRYGEKYILISSNFTVNSIYGKSKFISKLNSIARDPQERASFERWFAYKEDTFSKYIESISELAGRIEDVKIVIRPHPGEDNSAWGELSSCHNVYIDSSFSLVSAIKSSRLVIHHGCTAALEGLLQGKTTIYFDPLKNKEHLSSFYRQISYYISETNELINKSLRVLNCEGEELLPYSSEVDQLWIDGNSHLRIIGCLERSFKNAQKLHYLRSVPLIFRTFIDSPVSYVKYVLRNYFPKLHPVGTAYSERCPEITEEDVCRNVSNYLNGGNIIFTTKSLTKNMIHIKLEGGA